MNDKRIRLFDVDLTCMYVEQEEYSQKNIPAASFSDTLLVSLLDLI